jgi:transcriptional regulator with GAF, ATPase, and Fis domain
LPYLVIMNIFAIYATLNMMNMQMTYNEFFRQATLKICGNLNIEESIFLTLQFLEKRMPVSIMFLEYYDVNLGSTRTVAKATPEGGKQVDFLTPLSPQAKKWASGYLEDYKKEAYLYQDPWARPYASEMMRFHKISLNSVILLPLETGGKVIGSLIVGCEKDERFSDEHAKLISLLSEPFAVAMSNAIRYSESMKLKDILADDNRYLHGEMRKLVGEEIIGANFGLRKVMQLVQKVAPMNSPVLIQGETGVGKEIIANAIHYSSPRNEEAFISVNCGAIPESLIDSELFGHEKGAFTGALAQKRGRFERADNGTIFLDEIGELPLQAQTRLLRVLQNMEFERVGGTKTIKLDVRIIAATNKNLKEMVDNRQFREDLWFRLNVFPLMIPPLRERKSDIPALVQYFIIKKTKELKLPAIPHLAPDALNPFFEYNWPGNIRELENIVERELIIYPEGPLKFSELQSQRPEGASKITIQEYQGSERLEDVMADHIRLVLTRTGGRIHGENGAAAILGVNASTLRNRMNKLGVQFRKRT